ncbi:hypothetical protein QJQ45_006440 [Haematococcus lacustris]|nr:hypothetical protein QJQ45_006440 [Haematococcus lacustris]
MKGKKRKSADEPKQLKPKAKPKGKRVAPHKTPQVLCSSQAATQLAALEPGPSTPPPAKRRKRTKAERAAEPTQPTMGKGKAQGKGTKAKPAPQPGRWLDRDRNAALNMQHIGESRWRPLELCWWPEQVALPAMCKEYAGLGYKRLRDKPPEAQQQPAEAQQAPQIWLGQGPMTLSMVDLRLSGGAACCLQIVIGAVLPSIEWYMAYKQDSRMHHLPIVFWVTTAGTGLLGVVAFVTARGVLLALHVTLSISLAAAVAAHNVLSFLLLRDKCLLSQTSFSGCQACPCAAQSLCTRALMAAQPGCSPCQAWPLDTCAAITGTNSLMAFMGLAALLLMALPPVWSLRALARVESEAGSLANKLQYARNMVEWLGHAQSSLLPTYFSPPLPSLAALTFTLTPLPPSYLPSDVVSVEVRALEAGRAAPLHLDYAIHLLRSLWAFGSAADHALVIRLAALLRLDLALMIEPGPPAAKADVKPTQVLPVSTPTQPAPDKAAEEKPLLAPIAEKAASPLDGRTLAWPDDPSPDSPSHVASNGKDSLGLKGRGVQGALAEAPQPLSWDHLAAVAPVAEAVAAEPGLGRAGEEKAIVKKKGKKSKKGKAKAGEGAAES